MTTYGYSIEWTTRSGRQSVGVDGCSTAIKAYEKTVQFAKDCGWTPPRWWQFWRWSDTRPKMPEEGVEG